MPYIGSSRYKYSPYLTVHFGKTEKFTAGDPVEPWESPPDLTGPCAYDNYVDSLNLNNWWKLSESFESFNELDSSSTGVNSGTNTTPIYRSGINGSGFNARVTPVVKNSCDTALQITSLPGITGVRSNIIITENSPFSLHGWFIIESSKYNFIFMTNAGQVWYTGMFVQVYPTGEIQLSFGQGDTINVPGNRRTYLSSPIVNMNTPTFIVINCTPNLVANQNIFEVWVNGALINMPYNSGDATTTEWLTDKYLLFGGSTINYLDGLIGKIDQVGHTNRYLTQTEIETMWNLGKP